MNKWGPAELSYINERGEMIASRICDEWDRISHNLERVRYDGKWGVFNQVDGQLIMPIIFDHIGYSNEGNLMRCSLNGKWGFYNEDGKEVIPCKYDYVGEFDCGLAEFEINGSRGFVTLTGKEVVSGKYDGVNVLSGEWVAAMSKGMWQLIDIHGHKISLGQEYDCITRFSDDCAIVKLNGKCGIINMYGEEVVPCKYDTIKSYDCKSGVATVCLNNKTGAIDRFGTEVIPCKYDEIQLSKGLALARLNGKWGVLDKGEREVVPFLYDTIEESGLSDRLWVEAGGKWGLVSIWDGNEVVTCKYDSHGCYINETHFSPVECSGRWGVLDLVNVKEVIPCEYDDVKDFEEGLAVVKLNGEWGVVDAQGNTVVPCKYDDTSYLNKGNAITLGVSCGGKWGVINITGEIVVPCQYDDFFGFSGGVYEFFYDLRPHEAREFVIPDGRNHVPDYAFSGCKELLHVRIPPMVATIGFLAFSECSSLVSIELPAGLIEIGPYAFSECTSLKSIIIPEGVSKIGFHAFENCSSLEVVVIPASVIEIEESLFAGCKSLKLISVDSRNPNYRAEGNYLIDKRTGKKA